MSTSQIPLLKSNLVATLTALLPAPVGVFYGHPGTVRVPDMVMVMDARAGQTFGPMATTHPRDEAISVDVLFSVFADDTQQVVTERAFAMLAFLETYVRTTDPTLGLPGGRLGMVSDYVLSEDVDNSGRVAEIAVTVTVTVRQ